MHEYVDFPPEVPMGFSTDGCYDNPEQILSGDGHPGVYNNSDATEGLSSYEGRKVFQKGTAWSCG